MPQPETRSRIGAKVHPEPQEEHEEYPLVRETSRSDHARSASAKEYSRRSGDTSERGHALYPEARADGDKPLREGGSLSNTTVSTPEDTFAGNADGVLPQQHPPPLHGTHGEVNPHPSYDPPEHNFENSSLGKTPFGTQAGPSLATLDTSNHTQPSPLNSHPLPLIGGGSGRSSLVRQQPLEPLDSRL